MRLIRFFNTVTTARFVCVHLTYKVVGGQRFYLVGISTMFYRLPLVVIVSLHNYAAVLIWFYIFSLSILTGPIVPEEGLVLQPLVPYPSRFWSSTGRPPFLHFFGFCKKEKFQNIIMLCFFVRELRVLDKIKCSSCNRRIIFVFLFLIILYNMK